MRYILIFTLCTKCLLVLTVFGSKNIVISKNLLLLNRQGNEGYTNTKLVVDKTINRQRRSILTTFINYISTAAETFRMQPLLVEGQNDVHHLSKSFKIKYQDSSKTINVMLSESARNGDKLNGIKMETENTNSAKLSKNASNGEKSDATKKKMEKLKNRKAKSKFSAKYDDEKSIQSVEKRLKELEREAEANETIALGNKHLKVRNSMKSLLKLYKMVDQLEEDTFQYLMENRGEITDDDINYLKRKGTHFIESEKIFQKLIATNPTLKDRLNLDIPLIKKMQNDIKKMLEEFPTKELSDVPEDQRITMELKLGFLKDFNKNWLRGNERPVVIIHESQRRFKTQKKKPKKTVTTPKGKR